MYNILICFEGKARLYSDETQDLFRKIKQLPYEPRVGMLMYAIDTHSSWGNPLRIKDIALFLDRGVWKYQLFLGECEGD